MLLKMVYSGIMGLWCWAVVGRSGAELKMIFLQGGRLLLVQRRHERGDWGVILLCVRSKTQSNRDAE
jgi:hypothetical protein